MAESNSEVVHGKFVQDLVLTSQDFEENYVYSQGGVGFRDGLDSGGIPVVDLALLLNSPSELAKLHHALSSWGCFQAINHGMTSSFLDKVRQVSKQFFELPKEEKMIYEREPNDMEGYGNDIIYFKDQKLDWSDRLYFKVQPKDKRKFKVWPEKPNDFRSTVLEYTERLISLNKVVLKGMAKSLNLEEHCLLKECGDNDTMIMRFNYYPRCPVADHVLGAKPHADGSTITCLLQDKEVEGLQVLKDNRWFKVPIIPEALLINVGDQIEIMSNGIFHSPIHRVVVNEVKDRLTVATFITPDPDKEIGPIEQLVNDSRPKSYKPVKNYTDIFFHYYQKGRRPIESSKIQQCEGE